MSEITEDELSTIAELISDIAEIRAVHSLALAGSRTDWERTDRRVRQMITKSRIREGIIQ